MIKSKLILASASPRRKELLETLDKPFTIVVPQVDETIDPKLCVYDAIKANALRKAKEVYRQYANEDVIVIGCDTMVIYKNHALGKPQDEKEAEAMLTMLNGQVHEVVSGVAILMKQQNYVFHEVTKVKFHPLQHSQIQNYIATKEPFDKAGAYGIQGKGKLFVEYIEGDYFNVVGLPISRIYQYFVTNDIL